MPISEKQGVGSSILPLATINKMFNQYGSKKTKVIRITLGILIPVVYTIIYIPPEVTIGQVIAAIIIFLVVIYIAIQAMKYYKIL